MKLGDCLTSVCCILLLTTKSNVKCESVCSGEDLPGISGNCTHIVSHTFSDSDLNLEQMRGKERLKEVHTYAELEHGLSLSDSFTICSSLMGISTEGTNYPLFFNIVDNHGKQRSIVGPWIKKSLRSSMRIDSSTWSTSTVYNKIPPVFPYTWVKSCMAINTTSGTFKWVVEGVLISDDVSEELADSFKLSKNTTLILGAFSYADNWYSVSNKVTNLNIFSSLLSIETMKSMTRPGSCIEKGDFLAWENMTKSRINIMVIEVN